MRGPRSPFENQAPIARVKDAKQKKAVPKSDSESEQESKISSQKVKLSSCSDSDEVVQSNKNEIEDRRRQSVVKEMSESDSDASVMKEPPKPPPRTVRRQNSRSSIASCASRSPSNSRQSKSPLGKRRNLRRNSKVTNVISNLSDDDIKGKNISSDEEEYNPRMAAKEENVSNDRHKRFRQNSTNARLKMKLQDDSEEGEKLEEKCTGRINEFKCNESEKRTKEFSRQQQISKRSSEETKLKTKNKFVDVDRRTDLMNNKYTSKSQVKITPKSRPILIPSASDSEKPKKVMRRRRSSVLQKNLPESSSDEEDDEVRKRPPKLQRTKQKKEVDEIKKKVPIPVSSDDDWGRDRRDRSESSQRGKSKETKRVCARPSARVKNIKDEQTSSESESYDSVFSKENLKLKNHVASKKRDTSPLYSSDSGREPGPCARRDSVSSNCSKDDLHSGHGKGPPKMEESPPKLDVEGNIKDRKKTETLMKLFSTGSKGGKGGKGGGGKGKGVPGIVVKCEPDRTERNCDEVSKTSNHSISGRCQSEVVAGAKEDEMVSCKKRFSVDTKKSKEKKESKKSLLADVKPEVKTEKRGRSPEVHRNIPEVSPSRYKNDGMIPSIMCRIDLDRISIVLKKRTSEEIRTKTEMADTRQSEHKFSSDEVKSEKRLDKIKCEDKEDKQVEVLKSDRYRTEKNKKRTFSTDEILADEVTKCDKMKKSKDEIKIVKQKSKESEKNSKKRRHERTRSPIISDTDLKKVEKTSDLGSDVEKTPDKCDSNDSDRRKQKFSDKTKHKGERKRRVSVSSVSTECSQKSEVPPSSGRRKDKEDINHKHKSKRRKMDECSSDNPKNSSPVSA